MLLYSYYKTSEPFNTIWDKDIIHNYVVTIEVNFDKIHYNNLPLYKQIITYEIISTEDIYGNKITIDNFDKTCICELYENKDNVIDIIIDYLIDNYMEVNISKCIRLYYIDNFQNKLIPKTEYYQNNGKKEGNQKIYNYNSNIKIEKYYIDGKLNGEYKEYDNDENLIKVSIYIDGSLVE